MKNPEQFKKSIEILVKAYFKGELNAWECKSCAIGNLLGHGTGSLGLQIIGRL